MHSLSYYLYNLTWSSDYWIFYVLIIWFIIYKFFFNKKNKFIWLVVSKYVVNKNDNGYYLEIFWRKAWFWNYILSILWISTNYYIGFKESEITRKEKDANWYKVARIQSHDVWEVTVWFGRPNDIFFKMIMFGLLTLFF